MSSGADHPASIPAHAKRVFEGVLFDVYQWEQEMFDGSIRIFEKLARNDATIVIPILPDGRILITEDEQPGRPMVITFPGGGSENGEDPETAGRRELLEETGYVPETMTFVRSFEPSSKIAWIIHTYVARGCTKAADPLPDAGERIVVRTVSLDELILLADDSRFQNREIQLLLIKARYDTEVRASLEKLLFG